MVSYFISRLVILIFGTLYPAYASYKAVRTKNVKEYVKWMMYWIVFAFFTCAETFTDLFLSFWFPFYYEIKIITVIYLLSPATKGSSILYRKFVHPVLIQREKEIDEYIAKAKEQGYYTMLNLGSKGVTYATSLIMQTAIKGGGGLVNQLKKSYSLGDLSEEPHLRGQRRDSQDDVDSRCDNDPKLVRRMKVTSPRRTISNANEAGLYFSEVDNFQRPLSPDEEHFYSHIPSSEEISSGYSSGDPLYYGMQKPKGDHLVRTASLGGSNRIRTRATTKTGLPKRSSLTEDMATWSAMEPLESQIEPEEFCNFPLSHSASFPFPFGPFGNLARPDYHIVQKRMFINLYPPFLNRSSTESVNKSEVDDESSQNPSVIISEVKNEGCKPIDPVKESNSCRTDDELPNKVNPPLDDKTEDCDAQGVLSVGEKVAEGFCPTDKNTPGSGKSKDDAEGREKSSQERSGKYNKKPAPTPPIEETDSINKINVEKDEDELEFSTPNVSPKLEKKFDTNPPKDVIDNLGGNKNDNKTIPDEKSVDLLEVPKKSGSKKEKKGGKKGDFHISQKLHLPKMPFNFWHQKSGKPSSGSETSSVASVEIGTNKSDLEYFIPLKDPEDGNDKQTMDGSAK